MLKEIIELTQQWNIDLPVEDISITLPVQTITMFSKGWTYPFLVLNGFVAIVK